MQINTKDLSVIKGKLKNHDNTNISKYIGAYVTTNEEGERQVELLSASANSLHEATVDALLGQLKKVLGGKTDKNLLLIDIPDGAAESSSTFQLITENRNTLFGSQDSCDNLLEEIVSAADIDTPFAIIMAGQTIDVPAQAATDEDDDFLDSENQYTFIICAVCPVAVGKADLGIDEAEDTFRMAGGNNVVKPPVAGFVFPVLDEGATDMNHALFYTKDAGSAHENMILSLFAATAPAPAEVQKEKLSTALADALGDECDFMVAQALYDNICAEPDPFDDEMPQTDSISKEDLMDILEQAGVSEEGTARFADAYDEQFGDDVRGLPKSSIIPEKTFTVKIGDDVKIQLPMSMRGLVHADAIGGVNYVMIQADGNVEINGLPVFISGGD